MTRWTAAALVLLLGLPASAQVPTWPLAGPNLIEDGSFEGAVPGTVARDQVPAGWHGEAYGSDGQVEVVAGGAPGQGEKCVKMTTTAENPHTGLHSALIPIEPGNAYLQCGWIRVEPNLEERYGLPYGRQFLDAEGQGVPHREGKSYNYVPVKILGAEWKYFEQLLMPDRTPEDSFCPDGEIPTGTTAIRIWALSYNWAGVGYYDGLGFYEVDYAAHVRTAIFRRITSTGLDAVVEEMKQAVASLPEEDAVAQEAAGKLADLHALKERLIAEDERSALEWEAEHQAANELIDTLLRMQWDLKIEALLHEADVVAGNE